MKEFEKIINTAWDKKDEINSKSDQSIIDAIQEIKSCLEILVFSLPNIKVKKNITTLDIYDELFTVDTLNQEVLDGKPFRDAYRELGNAIEKNTFKPNRDVKHSHIGSIGNLGLDIIRKKMENHFS